MTHLHLGLIVARAANKLIPDDDCPACGKPLGFFEGDVCDDCLDQLDRERRAAA